jgi:lysophospholipase L1-like esterase
LIKDWQGNPNIRGANEFYEETIPDSQCGNWDHETYVPDLIGLCVGSNDLENGIPEQISYVRLYCEFIRKLRRDAPNARILLITAPNAMDLPGKVPNRSVQLGLFQAIVERLNDPKVHVIQIGHYDGVPGDWHPSGTAHRAVTRELEPVIREVMGW